MAGFRPFTDTWGWKEFTWQCIGGQDDASLNRTYPTELTEASQACDPGDEHVATPAEGVRIPLAIDWGADNGTVETVVKVRPCYACDADTTALRSGVPVCVKCAG